MPHITEELWHRCYDEDGSIHRTDWPHERGYEADLRAGETAMEAISALRRYKTDHALALNTALDHVEVYGHVEGFADVIADVMHVETLETYTEAPEITTEIADIDLDYATVGPEYGAQVQEIDAAIDEGAFELVDGTLLVGDGEFELGADLFEIEETRTYSGEGEMIETENAVVVVQDSG